MVRFSNPVRLLDDQVRSSSFFWHSPRGLFSLNHCSWGAWWRNTPCPLQREYLQGSLNHPTQTPQLWQLKDYGAVIIEASTIEYQIDKQTWRFSFIYVMNKTPSKLSIISWDPDSSHIVAFLFTCCVCWWSLSSASWTTCLRVLTSYLATTRSTSVECPCQEDPIVLSSDWD